MSVGGKPTTPSSTPPATVAAAVAAATAPPQPVPEIKPDLGNSEVKVEIKQEPMETTNNGDASAADASVAKKEPREVVEESSGSEVKPEVKAETHGPIATKEEPGGSSVTPMEETKPSIDQKPKVEKSENSSTPSTSGASSNSAAPAGDNKTGVPRNKKSEYSFLLTFFGSLKINTLKIINKVVVA